MQKTLETLQFEADMSYLYQVLAEEEEDGRIREVYQKMSDIERRHAEGLLNSLERETGRHPDLPSPSWRARVQAWLVRRFGSQMVLSNLVDSEKAASHALTRERQRQGVGTSGFEYNHPRILRSLMTGKEGLEGGRIATLEGRHRTIGGNALRAAVLGANDGLVSNLSLVMGVAGAVGSNESIIVAGFAGLLAGAISMALGEWLSVQSSRELYQRQISIEAEELRVSPEEEARELSLIYQAKGFSEAEAAQLTQRLLENKEIMLDTLAREELGIDPEELGGSAWEAALTSFLLFAFGAIIPLAPFLFLDGTQGIIVSLAVSTVGLFLIGAGITLMTGKGLLYSGLRQVLFGLAAAGVTYGIGYLVGVSLVG